MESFGLDGGGIAATLEIIEENRKTKTPPATGAGGVLEKIDDLYQIVNYLPASWVKGFFSLPSLEVLVPESRQHRVSATHTSIPINGDHWVGWRGLV
jgi:hypothetical protein